MHPEFGEGVPFCRSIQQCEDDSVKWLWEEPIKNGNRALEDDQGKRLNPIRNETDLQDILEVTRGKFLHFRHIV
jgi:hypothetical protein